MGKCIECVHFLVEKPEFNGEFMTEGDNWCRLDLDFLGVNPTEEHYCPKFKNKKIGVV